MSLQPPALAHPVEPLTALRAVQAGRCSGCARTLPPNDLRSRSEDGVILGLVCKSCSILRTVPRAPAPYLQVDALARLRLRLPHHLRFDRTVTPSHDAALLAGDWDEFDSPTHALWVHQKGACALPWHLGWAVNWATEPLVLDHDHTTGLARALLCQRCNVIEGKARRGQRMAPLLAFRLGSPAQQCPGTAGLSYNYLTRGGRS